MKAVILAGGLGSRISEETTLKPKPMVEVAGKPILWHIMKTYSHYGINDFVICLGYKGYVVKEWFANYNLHMSSAVTFDFAAGTLDIHRRQLEPWRVTLVDTGENSQTGGRLKRVAEYLRGEDAFCFTYGDGVTNLDIAASIDFHRSHGKLVTVTAVQPAGRYGALDLNGTHVMQFQEKPKGDGGWINGGYFVVNPAAIDLIEGDHSSWEHGTLELIAGMGQLEAFLHRGFWQAMDTMRDKAQLEALWSNGRSPWKTW